MRRNIGKFHLTALTALAIVSATSAPVAAQTQGSGAPAGSYLQSCSAISFDNGVLSAACKSGYNTPRSSIEPAQCSPRGDIANQNGKLVCEARSGTWGKGAATPFGSYKQSCRDIDVRPGPMLVANCADNNGAVSAAQLDLNRCQLGRPIGNQYGQLICTPRKDPPPTIRQK